MVDNYKLNNQYRVGGLKPYVYLLADDCMLNYTVDNGEAIVNGLSSGTVYKLNCGNVILNSEETINGRFKFKNTLTLNLYEKNLNALNNLIHFIIHNDWKIVVEDNMGKQYICNIEFPSSITYNYQFNTANILSHNCQFTFATDSNFPVLEVKENVVENAQLEFYDDCSYNIGNIKKLKMCVFNDTYIEKDDNSYSFFKVFVDDINKYKEIEFLPNSFTFGEQFNGSLFTDTLTFTLPLDDYKSYWSYNLIEFKQNKYVVLFETDNHNVIASGFDNGFFPSYTITTSQSKSSLNTITITLKHVSEQPCYVNNQYSIDELIEQNVDVFYTNIDPFYVNDVFYDTSVCISSTQSAYILLQEIMRNGIKLDKYWVLDGYEDNFDGINLNIVGTYKLSSDMKGFNLIYNSNVCENYDICTFIKTPQPIINFTPTNTEVKVNIQSTCDWLIWNKPEWLDIDITEGYADEDYEVTLKVVDFSYSNESTFYIFSGQNEYVVNVSKNVMEKWVAEEGQYVCEGHTSYEMLYQYISEDGVNWIKIDNWRTGNIIKTDDDRCEEIEWISTQERWIIERNTYICEKDGDTYCKYKRKRKQYNFRNSNVFYDYSPQIYAKGELIECGLKDCTSSPEQPPVTPPLDIYEKWITINNEYICDGYNKCYKLQRQISQDGINWEDTNTYKAGEIIEVNAIECTTTYV